MSLLMWVTKFWCTYFILFFSCGILFYENVRVVLTFSTTARYMLQLTVLFGSELEEMLRFWLENSAVLLFFGRTRVASLAASSFAQCSIVSPFYSFSFNQRSNVPPVFNLHTFKMRCLCCAIAGWFSPIVDHPAEMHTIFWLLQVLSWVSNHHLWCVGCRREILRLRLHGTTMAFLHTQELWGSLCAGCSIARAPNAQLSLGNLVELASLGGSGHCWLDEQY